MKQNGFVRSVLIVLLVSAVVLVPACQRRGSWTAEERENIRHFSTSLEADKAAIRLLERGVPWSTLSPDERAQILRLERQALEEARAVRDDVLAKAHPALPDQYREYKRSLELRIGYFDSPSNIAVMLEADALHARWVDWYDAHRHEIKFPE